MSSPDPGVASPVSKRRAASAVAEICPYLRAESGAWRSAYPSPDHRCGAVDPAAPLAVGKQRSLCLLPTHTSCATYVVAGGAGGPRATAAAADDGDLWPPTRSTPVVLEPPHGLVSPLSRRSARTGGQAVLVVLMVVAFLALVVARTTTAPASATPSPLASGGVAVVPSPSPAVTPDATPSMTLIPSASATPVPATSSPSVSPAPTPTATVAPSPTPDPNARRYTVRSGDTLSSIAAKFGVTVKALRAANSISDPRLIHPGQVLVIPAP